MRLEVSPVGEVRVTVPERFRLERVHAFVAEHSNWLARTLERIRQRQQAEPDLFASRPQRICLQALDRHWDVRYQHGARAGVRVEAGTDPTTTQLIVQTRDNLDNGATLRAWLQRQAQTHLIPWLERTSAYHGLRYHSVSIRSQKTRWGSCSARKNISLNRALLFLPPELVEYLLVHELCHTQHLNHSLRYWNLVERCDPDYARKERELSRAQRWVPAWAHTPHNGG